MHHHCKLQREQMNSTFLTPWDRDRSYERFSFSPLKTGDRSYERFWIFSYFFFFFWIFGEPIFEFCSLLFKKKKISRCMFFCFHTSTQTHPHFNTVCARRTVSHTNTMKHTELKKKKRKRSRRWCLKCVVVGTATFAHNRRKHAWVCCVFVRKKSIVRKKIGKIKENKNRSKNNSKPFLRTVLFFFLGKYKYRS